MVWKQVSNADGGDTDHFGGNDLDKISQLLTGTDVDDVVINVDWKWEHFQNLKEVAEPATPASGYVHIWPDSTTHKLSVKHSDGRVVILE